MVCEIGSTLLVRRFVFLKSGSEPRTASDTSHTRPAIHEQTHNAPVFFQGQIHQV